MKMERFNRMLLESVEVALAILDPRTLEVVFHNKRFGEWFPLVLEGQRAVTDLMPKVDVPELREHLELRGDYMTDTEVRVKRRPTAVSLRFSWHVEDDLSLVTLECTNVSKLRELEYMIESYSNMLEKQNRTLVREKERVEKLLLNIMPKRIYEELKTFGVTTPQRFESASVLMLDFVSFTDMAVTQDPSALIAELNDIFTSFDRIAEQFGCERIKTVGDAYMAVCGMPDPVADHAQSIAKIALLFLRYLERRNASHTEQWRARIGIASGPVIGSIVGVQKYVYDIFGPGVNLASRMETFSDPMEVTVEESMYQALRGDFRFEEKEVVDVKGFGRRKLFRLTGEAQGSIRPRRRRSTGPCQSDGEDNKEASDVEGAAASS
jgi:adenylate cyclase